MINNSVLILTESCSKKLKLATELAALQTVLHA